MAAVGSVLEEKEAGKERKDSQTERSPLASTSLRNSANRGHSNRERGHTAADSKLTKYSCIVKINGLKSASKQSQQTPSDGAEEPIQLRSRTRTRQQNASSVRNRPKLTNAIDSNIRENQLGSKYDSSSSEEVISIEASIQNNNLIIHADSVHNKEHTQNCDNDEHIFQHPSSIFHVKDVELQQLADHVTNGHKFRVKKIKLHQNGCLSPTQNGCHPTMSAPMTLRGSVSPTQPSQTSQIVTKAAKTTSEPFIAPSGDASNMRSDLKVVLGRISTSSTSCAEKTMCSTAESATRTGIFWPGLQRTQSPFSLSTISQDNSCSSSSSLISLSSQEASVTTSQGCTSSLSQDNSSKQKLTMCKWDNCGSELPPILLTEHLLKTHTETQTGESFVCLWEGCKVYNKTSSSRKWLDRHLLTHSGDKPFPCIVDGCGQQFMSQYGLERHVNSHFNGGRLNQGKSTRLKDDTPSKQNKKKKARRKRTMPVKTDDFFDTRTMGALHCHLVESDHFDLSGAGKPITFQSSVIARRTDSSGQVQVLLHWTPENILIDSWESEVKASKSTTRVVHLSELPRDSLQTLHSQVSSSSQYRTRKHRRK